MSEPSGRYQSRILSFVARQTQKLTDRTATVLRQVKVMTIWSTQIVLYPVYALFQTTRLVGRQLRQTVQTIQQRLLPTPPAPAEPVDWLEVDTPIRQVLATIAQSNLFSQLALAPEPDDSVSIIQATRNGNTIVAVRDQSSARLDELVRQRETSTGIVEQSEARLDQSAEHGRELAAARRAGSPLPIVQGIACLLASRCLVLVAADNQLLDILTADQQHHLQRQIILAMANHWYEWRRRTLGPGPAPLPPPRDRPTALLPVRLFSQLMAWMQTGPIATTANLFQEATWAITPAAVDWFTPALSPSALALEWSLPSLPTRPDWQALTQQMPHPTELPDLIRAAIRYFFGTAPVSFSRPSALPLLTSEGEPESRSSRPFFLRSAHPQPIADPWLTLADLGDDAAATSKVNPSARQLVPSQLALPPRPNQPWGNPIRRWFQRYGGLQQPVLPHAASVEAPLAPVAPAPIANSTVVSPPPVVKDGALSSITTRSALVPPTAGEPATLTVGESQLKPDRASSPTPLGTSIVSPTSCPLPPTKLEDWIETPATAVGYVKHPLAQLLEWVDQILLWLEERLLALWHGLGR